MKKITFIFAISLSLLFTSCLSLVAKEIKGNGKLTKQSISISNFSQIEIETCVTLDYSQEKNTGKLEFTVDNNLLEYYDIYTKGDVLHIGLKKEYKPRTWLNPTKSLITVSSEQLEHVEIAGSSVVNFCTDFTSKKLNIELAGSGKIMANKYPVKIQDCEIEIAGSGSVQLKGAIQKANVEIAGSGNVKALDCNIARLNIEIAGSGNVEAHVTDKLAVEIAGSGNVKYTGNPSVDTDIAGSGRVKKL